MEMKRILSTSKPERSPPMLLLFGPECGCSQRSIWQCAITKMSDWGPKSEKGALRRLESTEDITERQSDSIKSFMTS